MKLYGEKDSPIEKLFKLMAVAVMGMALCAIGYALTSINILQALFLVGIFGFVWGVPLIAIFYELNEMSKK